MDVFGPRAGASRPGLDRRRLGEAEARRERERAVEALEESQRKLAEAQRIGHIGNWRVDIATGRRWWSEETYRILGIVPATVEAPGREIQAPGRQAFLERVHPDDRDRVDGLHTAATENGAPYSIDYRLIRPDGSVRAVHERAEVSLGPDGRPARVAGTTQDITERKRLEDELREAARFFDVARDLLCTARADGRFQVMNGSWTETLGWTLAELRARPFVEFVHPEDFAPTEREVERLRAGRATSGFRNRYRTKQGGWRWLEWTAVYEPDEELIYASARDVTERVEVERALREAESRAASARDDAIEASRMKSMFLANMSHEIRTPLNGVVGATELLLESDLGVRQRESIRMLSASAATLLAVVNDVMDISKIEAGAIEIEVDDFDLIRAVEEVCALFAVEARAKGVEMRVDFDAALPDAVRGDVVRVRQVLGNLVSNAVKFTDRGAVDVRAMQAGHTGRDPVVRVEVQDTGIGIERDRAEALFESFAQADASTTRRHGGAGLGLAIVRDLVELMGGRVGVRSAPRRGSTFWFELPFEAGTVAGLEEEEPLEGLRLLVVVGDAALRRSVTECATASRMSVAVACGGEEALERLRRAEAGSAPFDCVALEIGDPSGAGSDLAGIMSANDLAVPPALVVLAGSLAEQREAQELGAPVTLTKPVPDRRLRMAMLEAIAEKRRGGTHPRGGASSTSGPEVDRRVSRVLVAEDNELNRRLVVWMLEKRGYAVDIATDGREALDALDGRRYGAVFMDCQMPRVDGYEATRELRRREHGEARTPVVALTAHALTGDRERCLAAGMDDYLAKPLRGAELDRVLARWAPQPRAEEPAPRPDRAGADEARPPLSPEVVGRLRSEIGDTDELQHLIQAFAAQGSEAVGDIRAAIARRDAAALRGRAHKLKGTAGTMGALHLSELCAALEDRSHAGLEGAAELADEVERELGRARAALVADVLLE